MDVELKNGVIVLTDSGDYRRISGMDELMQRIRVIALTKKGSFIYDRDLGCDYSGLSPQTERLKDHLDMRLKEAAAVIPAAQVTVIDWNKNTLKATLMVSCGDLTGDMEVDYAGIL